MTIPGYIQNGQIVLANPLQLPDGAEVTVSIQPKRADLGDGDKLPSLFDRLKSVAGKANGLPSDLAINHDHYLHGQPKRQ